MRIPCVDIIVEKGSKILTGFRVIDPYRNVWALPGGRILKREYPEDAAQRVLDQLGLEAKIGGAARSIPSKILTSSIRTIRHYAMLSGALDIGRTEPDFELAKFIWVSPRKLPAPIGGNYKKMIATASLGGR